MSKRYWYPFVGQALKNTNGTPIQQSNNVSRHERSRRSANNVATATAMTRMPKSRNEVSR